MQEEVEQEEAEHGVHVRLEDAIDQVAELCVDCGKLNETKDGSDDKNVHMVGLRRDRSDNFTKSWHHRGGFLNVAFEGSIVAHGSIKEVPANDAKHRLSHAVAK